jgi:hypothetical protein
MEMPNYPRPFLDREEADERLRALGFEFTDEVDPKLASSEANRARFTALQELIAGAVAEWSDARPDEGSAWDQYDLELQEWAQEWLAG